MPYGIASSTKSRGGRRAAMACARLNLREVFHRRLRYEALEDRRLLSIGVLDAVKNAPVLSGANNFTTINEDQTNNGGSLVWAVDWGKVADPDTGALQGIAVTAVSHTGTGSGHWQYSLDGGCVWIDVGIVSDSQALLLGSADRLRFCPDTENGETGTVTFRAWDQTSGTDGAKVDVTSNGGTMAFSSATATAAIVVTDVNNAPMLSAQTT